MFQDVSINCDVLYPFTMIHSFITLEKMSYKVTLPLHDFFPHKGCGALSIVIVPISKNTCNMSRISPELYFHSMNGPLRNRNFWCISRAILEPFKIW